MNSLLIGEGALLAACFELLEKAGHRISVVVSPSDNIRQLCKQRQIDYFSHPDDLFKPIKQAQYPIDYLWSINNGWVLEPWLIALPNIGAINFHNAPLPRYRGLNAVAWAIYHDEKHHGITWHKITRDIDAGPILLQDTFPIPPHSTAMSLNLICCQKALETLPKLLNQLTDHFQGSSQDESRMTYYARKDMIDTVINWDTSNHTIDRLQRTLEFGTYLNTLGLPQLYYQNNVFFPLRIRCCRKSVSDGKPAFIPGTVLKISHQVLTLATAQGAVDIQALGDRYGIHYSPIDFCRAYALHTDDRLSVLSEDTRNLLVSTRSNTVVHETFWKRYWQAAHAHLSLPFQSPPTTYHKKPRIFRTTHKVTHKLIDHSPYDTDALTAICLVFLARLTRNYTFTVGIINDGELPKVAQTFWVDTLPLSVSLNTHEKYGQTVDRLKRQIGMMKAKKPYPVDFLYRMTPDLSKRQHMVHFPVVFHFNSSDEPCQHLLATSCLFHIKQGHVELAYDPAGMSAHFISYAHQFSRYFSHFIKHVSAEQTLDDIPVLSSKDKQQILLSNLAYRRHYPNKLVHQLFEQQVDLTPQQAALGFCSQTMCYRQLDQKANALAHQLRPYLTAPPCLVVLCCKRSPEMIISLLAILKAGGAYVPIDADLPDQRILNLLDHIRPHIILTSPGKQRYRLERLSSHQTPVLEVVSHRLNETAGTRLPVNGLPTDLAYVIYTSGTTGKPKGVMMEHHSLVNRLTWMREQYTLQLTNRFLQKTPLTFDWSFAEVFLPLVSGACLVLDTAYCYKDPDKLTKLIQRASITDIHFVPSMLQAFMHHLNSHGTPLKSVRRLYASGEALHSSLSQQTQRLFPHADIHNLYGPTEGGEVSYAVYQPKLHSDGYIPIGKPIANSEFLILDSRKQLVPVGVSGTLYLGGATLARGYLHNKTLTQSRFIPNPFCDYTLSPRIYDTGDQARWLPNGEVDFLGRSDHQVKLRGVRIELEEIDSILCQHSMVKQSATKVFQKHLVAYLVMEDSCQEALASVKAYVQNHLPKIMVPAAFITIDRIPLTAHGKRDYCNLPLPSRQHYTQQHYHAPKTQQQCHLASIWKKLLDLQSVGMLDDFFTVGGDSISLIQLLGQLKSHYGRAPSMTEFLASPTITCLDVWLLNKPRQFDIKDILSDIQADVEQGKRYLAACRRSLTDQTTFTRPDCVFITGATGFLGIHLLVKLAQFTPVTLYCLVRANHENLAWQRIQQAAHSYRLRLPDRARIHIVCGDLSLPKLGLNEERFAYLSEKIDIIYHVGAQVNHVLNYQSLRRCNVLGTIELLAMATSVRFKTFYYISSLGVTNVSKEAFLNNNDWHSGLINGYLQTKWASEMLVKHVANKGLPVSVFRPSWIVALSARDNHSLPYDDHLVQLIKGCLELGYIPDWHAALNLVSAEWVSDILVRFIKYRRHHNVFHIANPNLIMWQTVIRYLKQIDDSIEVISPQAWCKRVSHVNKNHPLYPLVGFYQSEQASFLPGITYPDCHQLKLLKLLQDIPALPSTPTLLSSYLRQFNKTRVSSFHCAESSPLPQSLR